MTVRRPVAGRIRRLLLAAALTAAAGGPALADSGHRHGAAAAEHHHGDTAYGRPGDAGRPARTVTVTMSEADDGRMLFSPSRIEVRRGEQIRFRLRNAGTLEHEMVLGTEADNRRHAAEMAQNPDMAHDDPNARRLEPQGAGEILWQFTEAGTFDFSCLIPGHREAGMQGTVVVR